MFLYILLHNIIQVIKTRTFICVLHCTVISAFIFELA